MTYNTELQEVYNRFIQKITTYEYINFTQEELDEEFYVLLINSLDNFYAQNDIEVDEIMGEFNRKLKSQEIDILATGMVVEWLNPKINNIELLKQSLSSKDFQFYSQSNHLKELINLKSQIEGDYYYKVKRYSTKKLTEKVGGG